MSSLAKSAVGLAALGAHLSGAADVASFTSSRVLFEKTEDNVGEGYRRLLEPMLQFVPATVTCPSSQVHLTLGGTGTNSMTVSWVNPSFVSANTVSYGMDTTMSSSATGTAQTYTQLLVANANLLFPKMGQAGATAAQILALYNTSSFAYDRDAVGRHWNNYKNPKPAEIANPTSPLVSSLGYSNPYAFYDSPMVHTTVLSNLAAGKTYYYKPAGACKTYNFTMTQAVNTYPFKAGLLADLGTTDVSAMSVAVLAAMKANVIVFTGDLSYADGWTPIWDVFGNMVENLLSQVPLLSVGGNHEIAGGENWQSYSARYPTNPQDSNSPNLCYHGREVGPMNIISLCSYGAMNYGGLNTGATSLQYQWLTNYLTTINRIRTPWVMVQFHAPMYSTNSFRYMEGEIFRRQYEALLYKYGVDIVMNGHVHAYERSYPVYNNTMNPCGAVHLVLGDAGNYKNADVPWNMPQKSWSAFREASFGVASLTILSSTTANITWHRHACGSATGGAPTYNQNFSSSCVTPGDNSANIAQSVDTVLLTKPSMASCPNRYVSAANPSAVPTVAPYSSGYARKALAVDAVDEPSPVDKIRVLFEVAPEETTGEGYRRLLEPMLQFVPPVVTCPSSQVHLTNGGSGHNSMTVNWVNPSLLSANTVSYGMDTTMSSTATGKAQAYTQLLGAQSSNLITPSMGQAGSTAAVMIGLANTSTFAYDHDTGRRWANYNNAYGTKKTPTGQLNFSDPFAFYDSPMIHTTVLSNLVAGKLYYYKPAGACKTYNFTMTQAVNTYPFKAGLLADLGTTDVSAMSVAVLIAMNANVIVFTGDLSYADGWTPIWDVFGVLMESLAAYVPVISVGGNHEIGSLENWQSYNARWPTNPQDSNSPNFCYHGREVGPMNIISLCSYGAVNYGGLNTGGLSLQYQWLAGYLAKINRIRTPWIMVQVHAPMYCTNVGHYGEAEIFRRQYEPLLYKYGVDFVMNGHVHAYERSYPVYNNTVDPCGITHLVLGDAGNYENAYLPWITPQKSWSAFREASFGVASLNIISSTQANYTWHRHACGGLDATTFKQNFSASCVTRVAANSKTGFNGYDNSATVALSVDTVLLTKPTFDKCPNRYASSVAAPSLMPTIAPGSPTATPSTMKTSMVVVTQTIGGVDKDTANSAQFKTDLTTSITTSLGVPTGSVTGVTVTYNARRQLLTTGTVVVYTLSVANMATSAISSLVATAISSGTLTTQLQQTYPSATANTAATVVDSTPTGSPVPPPVNAYSIPSCFAGSETVELESGDLKAIADVRSGDRVLAADGNGKAVFSEVIFVPHGANKEIALFVHITTTNGRDVKMTQNHLLPAGICGSTLPLVYASDVSVGDCVQTVSGEEKVSATESVRGEGVYTIVTKEEFIVVNGIVASPFGANHMMANLYYNIHRFVYDLAPVFLTSSLMHAVNEGLGVFVPFFAASA